MTPQDIIPTGRVWRKCWKCREEWNVSKLEPFDRYDKYICPNCEKTKKLKERLKKGSKKGRCNDA